MYTYDWFMLRFDRKQQNPVKQLSLIKKLITKSWYCSETLIQSGEATEEVWQTRLSLGESDLLSTYFPKEAIQNTCQELRILTWNLH